MTRAQIEREIALTKKKINNTRLKIDNYSTKIKKLEKAYGDSKNLKSKYQRGVQDYYNAVRTSLNKLDSNSTFKDYFIEKTKKVLNGKEDSEIIDTIARNSNDILKRLDDYEKTVKIEQSNLQRYYERLNRLKIELDKAVE
ncbi:MAG: hypothetical protein ACI4IE_09010 [Eubacterium sp.]